MRDPYIDRSTWGSGEWDNEPDRKCWMHHGVPCLILRHPTVGHLCGYIGLLPDHPWHKKHYNAIDAECHGGLTSASPSNPLYPKYQFLSDCKTQEEEGFRDALLADATDAVSRAVYQDWLLEHDRDQEADLVRDYLKLWWIGFDCNHAWDISPGMRAIISNYPINPRDQYRNIRYVTDEVTSLAEQSLTAVVKVGAD